MPSIFGTKGIPWNDVEPAVNDAAVPVRIVPGSLPSTVPAANATQVGAASGNVANAAAVATLPAVAAKLNYLTGVQAWWSGSTAALVVNLTIAGLKGGTITLPVVFPAGATVAGQPVNLVFETPFPASAVNTAIVVTLPAGGAGNTNAAVAAQGFVV